MPQMVAGCILGAATDLSLNLYADYVTGRKSRWQDALSLASLRYAGTGCAYGAVFAFGGMVAGMYAEALFPIGVGAVIATEMGAAGASSSGAEAGAAANTANDIGVAGEEAVSDAIGIPRNTGPGQVTVPGTGPGGYRIPDFDPDLTIPSRGTVVEVKNVQELQISDQIRDLLDYANNGRGVPLEIFTNGRLPVSGELFNFINSGRIIITPIP